MLSVVSAYVSEKIWGPKPSKTERSNKVRRAETGKKNPKSLNAYEEAKILRTIMADCIDRQTCNRTDDAVVSRSSRDETNKKTDEFSIPPHLQAEMMGQSNWYPKLPHLFDDFNGNQEYRIPIDQQETNEMVNYQRQESCWYQNECQTGKIFTIYTPRRSPISVFRYESSHDIVMPIS